MSKSTDCLELFEYIRAGHTDEQICRYWGGRATYIPKLVPDLRRRLKAEFNGVNQRRLASKYGVSESHVRKLLNNH